MKKDKSSLHTTYLRKLQSLLWCSLHRRNSSSSFFSSALAATRARRVYHRKMGIITRVLRRTENTLKNEGKIYGPRNKSTRSRLRFSAICSRSCCRSLSLSSRALSSACTQFEWFNWHAETPESSKGWLPLFMFLNANYRTNVNHLTVISISSKSDLLKSSSRKVSYIIHSYVKKYHGLPYLQHNCYCS